MEGIIYLATNQINGKQYVGQTISKLRRRMLLHLGDAGRGRTNNYFHNAIKKYGKENIIFEQISSVIANTKELLIFYLNILEDMYINKYDTFENGYNTIKGGNNKIYHESVKRKMSESTKGRIVSEETRKKISMANRGDNHWLRRNKMSEETRKKISMGKMGKKIGPCTESRKQNIINALSQGEYLTPYGSFISSNQAAKALKKSYTAITAWCIHGNNKRIKKLHIYKSPHIFDEKDLGKTFKEMGYGFVPNNKYKKVKVP